MTWNKLKQLKKQDKELFIKEFIKLSMEYWNDKNN